MKLNKAVIELKFNDIQSAIERLSKFIEIERDAFLSNSDFIHIARSHLLIAAEASINICYHIAAKRLEMAAVEYSSCFELLREHNLVSKELSDYLIKIVGLRNRMIHRYKKIDYGFIYDNLKGIIENLQKLINEVSRLLESEK